MFDVFSSTMKELEITDEISYIISKLPWKRVHGSYYILGGDFTSIHVRKETKGAYKGRWYFSHSHKVIFANIETKAFAQAEALEYYMNFIFDKIIDNM